MITLPKIPAWMEREILNFGLSPTGLPRFRMVDGQKEMIFMGGRWRTKYQLTEPESEFEFTFERINGRTGKIHRYAARELAENEIDPDILPEIKTIKTVIVREIGYPCYIVECWTSPDELNEPEWAKHRYSYEYNDLKKKYEMVDMLGEFPRDGKYVWCFPVLNDQGEAIAPNQNTLDELKRRIRIVENDTRTVQQKLIDEMSARREAEARLIDKTADDFRQEAGIHLKLFKAGNAISRPIKQVKQDFLIKNNISRNS